MLAGGVVGSDMVNESFCFEAAKVLLLSLSPPPSVQKMARTTSCQ